MQTSTNLRQPWSRNGLLTQPSTTTTTTRGFPVDEVVERSFPTEEKFDFPFCFTLPRSIDRRWVYTPRILGGTLYFYLIFKLRFIFSKHCSSRLNSKIIARLDNATGFRNYRFWPFLKESRLWTRWSIVRSFNYYTYIYLLINIHWTWETCPLVGTLKMCIKSYLVLWCVYCI